VLSQDSCHLSPTRPKILVGYYPAYKLYLTPGVDFDISPSIDYLIYIAFGPNDLVNNGANLNAGGDPLKIFNSQYSKFYELLNYKTKNTLKFKIILSVQLPTDGNNLTKFFNKQPLDPIQGWYKPTSTQNTKLIYDLMSTVNNFNFDGIDIDYPFKSPCSPSIGFNDSDFLSFINAISTQLGKDDKGVVKSLTITAGQNPIKGINSNIISFINIQAFRLNINSMYASAGIDRISTILNNWNFTDYSKLFLGVEFGGIVETVSSKNIKSDIENQNLQLQYISNLNFPFVNEQISDPCKYSSYAYLSWENLSSLLSSSSCPTNLISSSPWTYGFISSARQPYLYQQQASSSNYYVTFYEDYQSLSAKLDYINNYNVAGIAIADISKDSKDLQLTNFILGIQPNYLKGGISTSSNIGAIVGGVIGSMVFIGLFLAAGFILYPKYKAKMSNPFIDTNQACSDTNPQFNSDINRQGYSDTDHKPSNY
ncbi:5140_t:CDS:2, partial [Cetraspora pellucida]